MGDHPQASWGSSIQSSEEQRRGKRDAILREAARSFRSRGFEQTSMTDIAAVLGVSKAALYRYVSNKQELLYECHLTASRFGTLAIVAAESEMGSGLKKLDAAIRTLVTGYFDPENGGAVIVDLDLLTSEQREHIVKERDRFTKALVKIVAGGIADGSIAPTDPEFAVFTLMGAFTWMTRWYSPDGKWKVGDVADMILNLFIEGLRPRKPG